MRFRKTPIKLYIGSLEVASRSDLLRHLEVGSSKRTTLEESFQEILQAVFPYTKTTSLITPQTNDVAVDIVVDAYSWGGSGEIYASPFCLPLMWRPKVRMSASLSRMKTGEKIAHIKATARLGWSEYLSSLLRWKVIFSLSSPTSQNRLEQLLLQAALALKAKIEKQV